MFHVCRAPWSCLSRVVEKVLSKNMRKGFILAGVLFACAWSLRVSQEKAIQKCFQEIQSGKSKCFFAKKNPRSLLEQKWGLKGPVLLLRKSRELHLSTPFQSWWVRKFERAQSKAPHFFSIQKAIWMGDSASLPFWLVEKYRERGLLPVLALSGQHVWALLLIFEGLVRGFWYFWGRPQGLFLFRIREWRVLFATLWLFSLAFSQPSMVRTALCAVLLFGVRRLSIRIENLFVCLLGLLSFVALFPTHLNSRGFLLSSFGLVGVSLVGICFQRGRRFFGALWLLGWLMPVVASFFGVWFGKWLLFSWIVSWIWEQLFLPLLFGVGIFFAVLPEKGALLLAGKTEIALDFWLRWEASQTQGHPDWIFRPSPLEVVIFAACLAALAYWNRSIWLNAQKNVPTARHALL